MLEAMQTAITPSEYANEVARVAEFLSTNGKSTVAALSAAARVCLRENRF